MDDFSLLEDLTGCARENNLPVYRIAMYKGGEKRARNLKPYSIPAETQYRKQI